MDNIQPNGEPKRIYLTKPPQNPTLTTEPTPATQSRSMRSCSGDVVRIPPRRHLPAVDKTSDEHISNHKKQRYWTSWEELYLVELWRRYKDELTIVNVPLPVYRKLMVGMRSRNMIVTAQDCRRKINTINTRYKLELQRIESTGCKSDWRLFPLVHCVLQPKIKEYDPWQETMIIQKLLDKLPKPVEPEVPPPSNHNSYNINNQPPQARSFLTPVNISSYRPRISSQPYRHIITPSPLSTVYTDSNMYNKNPSVQNQFDKKYSILPFRNISVEKVEKLRQENIYLKEQRDADLKCLKMEETNFKTFESFIRIWTEQKEVDLCHVHLMYKQAAISIENGQNHNGEQLQETVIAK